MKKNLKVKIIALSLVVLLSTGGIVYAVTADGYEPYEESGLKYESGTAVSSDVADAINGMSAMREGVYGDDGVGAAAYTAAGSDDSWKDPDAWGDADPDLDMHDYSVTDDKVVHQAVSGSDDSTPLIYEEGEKTISTTQPESHGSNKSANKRGTVKKLTSTGSRVLGFLSEHHFRNEVLGYLSTISTQLTAIEGKIDDLDAKMDEALRMLSDIEEQLAVIEEQLDEISDQLDEMQAQLNDMESEMIMNQINTYMSEIYTYANTVRDAYGYLMTSSGISISGGEAVFDESISETEKLMARNDFLDIVKNELIPGLTETAGYMYRNGSELEVASGVVNTPNVVDQVIFLNAKYYDYYNEFSGTLDSLYENFTTLLIFESLLEKEYYNYYAGPFNPNSPYHDIYDTRLQKLGRYITELDAVTLSTYAFDYGRPMSLGSQTYQIWPIDRARPFAIVSEVRVDDIFDIDEIIYQQNEGYMEEVVYEFNGPTDEYYGNEFYAGGAEYKMVTDFSDMEKYFAGRQANESYYNAMKRIHGITLSVNLSNGKIEEYDVKYNSLNPDGTVTEKTANRARIEYFDTESVGGLDKYGAQGGGAIERMELVNYESRPYLYDTLAFIYDFSE